MALAVLLGAVPASAQIISTSIPKAETAGAQGQGKRFALHVMASPYSKWRYNELVAGVFTFNGPFGFENFGDIGLFTGTPNSDFLLAGEAVVKLGKSFTVGGGGWYNKVGKVQYNFDVNSYNLDTEELDDHLTGTLQGDLKLSEGHASVFYKDLGVQVGVVKTRSALTGSNIVTSVNPSNKGKSLDSIEVGEDSIATDWDLYGVYKFGGARSGLSAGAGVYNKRGSEVSSQRSSEDQAVFSGFLTGTVDVYKGLGLDLSYWYIAKTKADFGIGEPVSSKKATQRFTIGIGYTFSR